MESLSCLPWSGWRTASSPLGRPSASTCTRELYLPALVIGMVLAPAGRRKPFALGLAGTMTHFACADEKDHPLTAQQSERWRTMSLMTAHNGASGGALQTSDRITSPTGTAPAISHSPSLRMLHPPSDPATHR